MVSPTGLKNRGAVQVGDHRLRAALVPNQPAGNRDIHVIGAELPEVDPHIGTEIEVTQHHSACRHNVEAGSPARRRRQDVDEIRVEMPIQDGPCLIKVRGGHGDRLHTLSITAQ